MPQSTQSKCSARDYDFSYFNTSSWSFFALAHSLVTSYSSVHTLPIYAPGGSSADLCVCPASDLWPRCLACLPEVPLWPEVQHTVGAEKTEIGLPFGVCVAVVDFCQFGACVLLSAVQLVQEKVDAPALGGCLFAPELRSWSERADATPPALQCWGQ